MSVDSFSSVVCEDDFDFFDLGRCQPCSFDEDVIVFIVDGKCPIFGAGDCFQESVVVEPDPDLYDTL